MGPVRLALALMVVLYHVIHLPLTGQYAVHVFFMMSGYLMTHVMHQSYGFTKDGWLAFWRSRILRLYPAYFVVLVFSALALSVMGQDFTQGFQRNFFIPDSGWGWFQNITMLHQSPFFIEGGGNKIVPQTWALTVELVFYMLISLGLSRTRSRVRLWIAGSVVYTLFWIVTGRWTDAWYYFSIGAGSLPFALGAWIYFNRDRLAALIEKCPRVLSFPRNMTLLSLGFGLMAVVMMAHWGLGKIGYKEIGPLIFLANLGPGLLIVAAVIDPKFIIFSRPVDGFLGDLSYPVYITHWIWMLIAGWMLGIPNSSLGPAGLILLAVSLPLTLAFSALLVFAVDRPVERFRARRNKPASAPAL